MTAFDLDLTRPMLAYASAHLSTGGIPTMTSSWPAAAHAWLQEIRAALARLPQQPDRNAVRDVADELAASALRLDLSATRALTASVADYTHYHRRLVDGAGDGSYSTLLIAWPRSHRTALHDHAGLWGIELVLDGVLEVEEFRRGDDDLRTDLAPERTLMLGVGDAAVFDGDAYVHRCANKSSTRPALSLHIYGGTLDAYHEFVADADGRYAVQPQRARVDARLRT